MVLYNVTVSVDPGIHDEWLDWMRQVHIPEVMATGCFLESRFWKVITPGDADEITYSIQYLCAGMGDYERYRDRHAAGLQAAHSGKYAGRFAAFRTILETA
jgi:hypothetical protein